MEPQPDETDRGGWAGPTPTLGQGERPGEKYFRIRIHGPLVQAHSDICHCPTNPNEWVRACARAGVRAGGRACVRACASWQVHANLKPRSAGSKGKRMATMPSELSANKNGLRRDEPCSGNGGELLVGRKVRLDTQPQGEGQIWSVSCA